ncbi:MAG: cell division protein ZapB [Marinobacterium sp.]|nr:cell division protein ZapB [Marinobacterium sp.]
MYNELLEQLEAKISQLLDEMELMRMEITELKEEKEELLNSKSSLEAEQTQSMDRLKGMLARFDQTGEAQGE